jgi:mono/diheme cytochrome c family protein
MKSSRRNLIGSLFCGILLFVLVVPVVSFTYWPGATFPHQQSALTAPEGEALYKQNCAVCHDDPQDRVPPLFLIRRRSAEDVMQTLTSGSMRQQASGLALIRFAPLIT